MANLKNLFNNLSALGNTASRWMRNPRLLQKLTTDPSIGSTFANVSRRLGNAASLASPITNDFSSDFTPTSAGDIATTLGRLGVGGNLAAMFDAFSNFAKLPASAQSDDAFYSVIDSVIPRMLR